MGRMWAEEQGSDVGGGGVEKMMGVWLSYSHFGVFSPDCTLHTAITHVITVLEQWILMWCTPLEFT